MTSYDFENQGDNQQKSSTPGQTINLQGVASFTRLVELLAHELGTNTGRLHGYLPNGPAAFNQLVGELEFHSQGFQRKLMLLAKPGEPLTLRFQSNWKDGSASSRPIDGNNNGMSGVAAEYYFGQTVEQILPQGRALARYAEDIFAVLDRMVTLGQSTKLANMSVSNSEIEAFEQVEAGNLVRQYVPKSAL